MFSLLHHPQRGWGIEDDYFERATWGDWTGVRQRDFDIAHRVYESLAKTGKFPATMNGYLFVEDPRYDKEGNMDSGWLARTRNLADLLPQIEEVRAWMNPARRDVAVLREGRTYGQSPRTAHVQEFSDGFRVWRPEVGAHVGGPGGRPFKTAVAAEKAMAGMRRTQPEQFSLFAKANRARARKTKRRHGKHRGRPATRR